MGTAGELRPIRRVISLLCVPDGSLMGTGSQILTAGWESQPCLLNNNVITALWDRDVHSPLLRKKHPERAGRYD